MAIKLTISLELQFSVLLVTIVDKLITKMKKTQQKGFFKTIGTTKKIINIHGIINYEILIKVLMYLY